MLDCEELSATSRISFKRNKHKEEDQESPVHGDEIDLGARNAYRITSIHQQHHRKPKRGRAFYAENPLRHWRTIYASWSQAPWKIGGPEPT